MQPRLVSGQGHYGKWTALSHRWGNRTAMFRTTSDTLSNRSTEISMPTLPLTFRDAAIITRAVNIRYLWIDALCIIQDDLDDWAQQSATMGYIYKYSVLTISATCAPDYHHGLLRKRENQTPVSLPFRDSHTGLLGRICERAPLKDWSRAVDLDSPLSSRGWVLQERMLPPRTLHVGDEQMFWECRICRVSEGELHESDWTVRGHEGIMDRWNPKGFLIPFDSADESECMASSAPPQICIGLMYCQFRVGRNQRPAIRIQSLCRSPPNDTHVLAGYYRAILISDLNNAFR